MAEYKTQTNTTSFSEMSDQNENEISMREFFGSKYAFFAACVGSAIGFGNVWRFPGLVFKYGGSNFLIPYVLSLIFLGIPILVLEHSLGYKYGSGDANAFGRINKRLRGVGIGSIFNGFILVVYYCILIAWVVRMFLLTFSLPNNFWQSASGTSAVNYFYFNVTGIETLDDGTLEHVTSDFVWYNFLALSFVWICIYLCVAFGIRVAGRIAYFTVGLPILLIIVLIFAGIQLDGADEGLRAYLGNWKFELNGEAWSEAVSQVFFSISVTIGVMTAFASCLKPDEDQKFSIVQNALIIVVLNSIYSFLSGIAVFSALGHLAKREQISINDINTESLGLAFGSYPVALSTLPGAQHWVRLWLVIMFFLGIDSAFAVVEGVLNVLSDTVLLGKMKTWWIGFLLCSSGYVSGLIFTTNTGIRWFSATDFYVNFMFMLIGILEAISIGWVYGFNEQVRSLGIVPVTGALIANVSSLAIGGLTVIFISSPSKYWVGVAAYVSSIAILMGIVLLELLKKYLAGDTEAESYGQAIKKLLIGNLKVFKDDLSDIGNVPWFVLISAKYFIPQLLFVLLLNLAFSKTEASKHNFGNAFDLPLVYQVFGISIVCLSVLIILGGAFFPEVFDCFEG